MTVSMNIAFPGNRYFVILTNQNKYCRQETERIYDKRMDKCHWAL